MTEPLAVLSNGLALFPDDFWRGMGAWANVVPLHHIPNSPTDNEAVLAGIKQAGGFGIFVTRREDNPPAFQKMIDGVTRSGWGHAGLLIGEEIAVKARLSRPDLTLRRPSHRWSNSPTHPDNLKLKLPMWQTTDGLPVPWIMGIRPQPMAFETVESKALVEVCSLRAPVDGGEQVIVFTNPNWTEAQKVAMAVEAYSWVGEPYDVFEIGSWVWKFIPNPRQLKVCSSLTGKCVEAGDNYIVRWAGMHGLDPERLAPRDIFAFGTDTGMVPHCIRVRYADALAA